MKTFLFLAFISLNAFAAYWNDLEEGKTYRTTQKFSLTQTERSHSLFEVQRGQRVSLKEIMPLSSAPVVLYVFDYKNCPGPAMSTIMEIIAVERTRPVVEIGAQLDNCELNIYVETKDLGAKALFE
jgi:hypothetical protein